MEDLKELKMGFNKEVCWVFQEGFCGEGDEGHADPESGRKNGATRSPADVEESSVEADWLEQSDGSPFEPLSSSVIWTMFLSLHGRIDIRFYAELCTLLKRISLNYTEVNDLLIFWRGSRGNFAINGPRRTEQQERTTESGRVGCCTKRPTELFTRPSATT
jgi:hypothetical protein